METIKRGLFKVADGEEITINVRSTGAKTLFGVNCAVFDEDLIISEGQPLRVTMDKSLATGESNFPNARSTVLTLLFSFTSNQGGRYDWTVTGSEGGDPFTAFAEQDGNTPKAVNYVFHIV
jgi:hypothetical protein